MSYNNQKTICGSIKEPCDKNNAYAVVNITAMEEAARRLASAAAFEMWMYFAKNQTTYSFDLSQKAVEQRWGMKKDQYLAAIQRLVDMGYLIQQASMPGETGRDWLFVERPDLHPDL